MKETLVLLPGMMCDRRIFTHQIQYLSNDFNIVVPQLAEPSIEAMAQAVLEQLPSASFNVVGLSMGGIVAMMMAKLAPERIKRLALLDTNHLADAPEQADALNDLRRRLDTLMNTTKDPRLEDRFDYLPWSEPGLNRQE